MDVEQTNISEARALWLISPYLVDAVVASKGICYDYFQSVKASQESGHSPLCPLELVSKSGKGTYIIALT